MRAAIAMIVIAACGPRAKATGAPPPGTTHAHPWGPPTVTRAAPAPFLDEPGLTQVAVSTTTPDAWGSSTVTRTQVLRAGRVVCELDGGDAGGAEHHVWRTHVTVVRRARAPLRFEARSSHWSNDGLAGMDGCTRYELPADGACKVVLDRHCTTTCTPEVAVATRPGAGRVVIAATGDGEPLDGAMIAAADSSQAAFTDATGAATLDPGAARTLYVNTGPGNAVVAIDPRADQDTVLTITATGCSCCALPAP